MNSTHDIEVTPGEYISVEFTYEIIEDNDGIGSY